MCKMCAVILPNSLINTNVQWSGTAVILNKKTTVNKIFCQAYTFSENKFTEHVGIYNNYNMDAAMQPRVHKSKVPKR